jgi:tetratricopeptide (TPR) repeat protein
MSGGVIIFVLLLAVCWQAGNAAELPGSGPLPPQSESASLTILADQLFWDGRFTEARTAYERVLALDSQSIPARLGLGRIADLLSQTEQARAQYSSAFQADPMHPDAVLAFASVVAGPARQTLLSNFLALNRVSNHDGSLQNNLRISDAVARLAMERKLAGRTLGTVVSPHQSYRLSLSELWTNNAPSGVTLKARINGGPQLRLQLDSGAKGLVLNPAAGRAPHLETLTGSVLYGFGSEEPTLGRVALAASLELGALKITNVLAQVSDTDLVSQADGLIGLDVFKDFVIHLNPRSRRLDLEPLDSAQACADCNQIYRLENLLLLHATINGQAEGNFILDTGSPLSLISHRMVAGSGRTKWLNGAQGQQEVDIQSVPASFRIGPQRFLTFDYATFDTRQISQRYGTSIAGAIGYSMLRELNLTVDFQRGLVKLSPR